MQKHDEHEFSVILSNFPFCYCKEYCFKHVKAILMNEKKKTQQKIFIFSQQFFYEPFMKQNVKYFISIVWENREDSFFPLISSLVQNITEKDWKKTSRIPRHLILSWFNLYNICVCVCHIAWLQTTTKIWFETKSQFIGEGMEISVMKEN
jgi:hypothetical protein